MNKTITLTGLIISRIDLGDAILNVSQPAFTNIASMSSPSPPQTFLSARLGRSEREFNDHCLPTSLLDLLRHVHDTTLRFESHVLEDKSEMATMMTSREIVLQHMSAIMLEDELLSLDKLAKQDFFSIACHCAANIHLTSLRQLTNFSSEYNQKLVHQLRQSLSQQNKEMWHETEPEIYIWMCFTGVAAAREGKGWFLAKAEPVVMSLKPDELHKWKSNILRFCRLLRYLKELDI